MDERFSITLLYPPHRSAETYAALMGATADTLQIAENAWDSNDRILDLMLYCRGDWSCLSTDLRKTLAADYKRSRFYLAHVSLLRCPPEVNPPVLGIELELYNTLSLQQYAMHEQYDQGMALLRGQRWSEAAVRFSHAQRCFAAEGGLHEVHGAESLLGWALARIAEGDLETALQIATRAQLIFERWGIPSKVALAMVNRLWLLDELGRDPAALALAGSCLNILEALGADDVRAEIRCLQLVIQSRLRPNAEMLSEVHLMQDALPVADRERQAMYQLAATEVRAHVAARGARRAMNALLNQASSSLVETDAGVSLLRRHPPALMALTRLDIKRMSDRKRRLLAAFGDRVSEELESGAIGLAELPGGSRMQNIFEQWMQHLADTFRDVPSDAAV